MKSLYQYILEADEDTVDKSEEMADENPEDSKDEDSKDEDSKDEDSDKPSDDELTRRANIKFTIWEEPKKKVDWLKSNTKYQKIEYQHVDKEKNIYIDFLLGFQDASWKLWIGKIGAITYGDDPWCDFETDNFKEAILAALDKVEEFIDDVEEDKDNWVQFYKNA